MQRRLGARVFGVAVLASSLTLLWGGGSGVAGPVAGSTVFDDPVLNGAGGQGFVVPVDVCTVHIVALGAAGGNGSGGNPGDGRNGGTADATIAVTPGETLHVFVGGRGGDFLPPGQSSPVAFGGAGGINGGGDAGNADTNGQGTAFPGGGGGGASDVRRGGTGLANRVVVAGGGGGGGGSLQIAPVDTRGGTGGGTTGGDGLGAGGGGGGTQNGGGTAGNGGNAGTPGQSGVGGVGAQGNASTRPTSGGGGGGGYFGGGGGGSGLFGTGQNAFPAAAGGGGGSGFTPDGTGLTQGGGISGGNGQVTITPGPATGGCEPAAAPAANSVNATPRTTG